MQAGWSAVEAPAPDRVQIVNGLLRSELRQGDRAPDGRARAEVRGLLASPATAPASTWPLAEGTERWISVTITVPADFTFASPANDGKAWLVALQIKGRNGGSPPNALEIKGGRWDMIVGHSRKPLAAVARGATTHFDIGLFLSADRAEGWAEVWVDGVQRLSRISAATMDTFTKDGTVRSDPVFLKNGLYQSTSWDSLSPGFSHILYYGPPSVTDTRPF